MRTRFYRMLENTQPPTPAGRAVDLFLIALISLNVVAAIVETVDMVHAQFAAYFAVFETVSIVIFSVEYLTRIWVSVDDLEQRGRTPLGARRPKRRPGTLPALRRCFAARSGVKRDSSDFAHFTVACKPLGWD